MTHGEFLYLLMVLTGFALFMVVLAYADHEYRGAHRSIVRAAPPTGDSLHAHTQAR